MSSCLLLDKALRYVENVINGAKYSKEEILEAYTKSGSDDIIRFIEECYGGIEVTNEDIYLACLNFKKDYEERQYDDSFNYCFCPKKLKKYNDLLKIMCFATGLNNVKGKPILPLLSDFQAFLLVNIFGWRFKDDKSRFRYREVALFISRKNAKGTVSAIIMILLMLTEEKYSELYSICIDKELAGELRKQIVQIIENSPALKKYFDISRTNTGKLECKITKSFYQARVSKAEKNNSIRPMCVVADEVGAFTTKDNINSMKSGQKSVNNPLLFYTTSAYANSESIMLEEIDYAKKVLRGEIENDRYFALLYYAEEQFIWNDIGLLQANPLKIKRNYEEIIDSRNKALEVDTEREEFITKSMNNFLETNEETMYLSMDKWKKCRVNNVDFSNREVVVGVDLSKTIDLTAVSIMYREGNDYYCSSHGFIPEETLSSKKRHEKIDYRAEARKGNCTIMSGGNIKYKEVCDYIRNIEVEYNCTIKYIAIDPAYSDVLLEELGSDYNIVILKQTYTVLSPPTKAMRDAVYEGRFYYEKNSLLDWNMLNATVSVGKSDDELIQKNRKSNNTRIDLVVVLIFAFSQLYLEDPPLMDIDDLLSVGGL